MLDSYEFSICVICYEQCIDSVSVLKCGHILHFECIQSWKEQKDTCPTCRAPTNFLFISLRYPFFYSLKKEYAQQQNVNNDKENLEHWFKLTLEQLSQQKQEYQSKTQQIEAIKNEMNQIYVDIQKKEEELKEAQNQNSISQKRFKQILSLINEAQVQRQLMQETKEQYEAFQVKIKDLSISQKIKREDFQRMSESEKNQFLNKAYNNFSLRCYKLDQQVHIIKDDHYWLYEENKELNSKLRQLLKRVSK